MNRILHCVLQFCVQFYVKCALPFLELTFSVCIHIDFAGSCQLRCVLLVGLVHRILLPICCTFDCRVSFF